MTTIYQVEVDTTTPILIFTTSNNSVINAIGNQNVVFTDRTYLYESNAFTFGVDTVAQSKYTNGAFQVIVANNGNNPYFVYAIDCVLFAPYESVDPYLSYSIPNEWVPYPSTTYSVSGFNIAGDYVGPAISNSFSSISNGNNDYSNYVTPSLFYINPSTPQVNAATNVKVPVYSFIGSPYQSSVVTCSNGGCANQGPTLPSRLNKLTRDWILYYQMNSSCNGGNPLIGNMGFPFYYSTTSNSFMYFQIIFALPMYGGQYLSTTVINNQGASSPTLPGYLFAFYRRSYPVCESCPYTPITTQPDNYLKYSPYTKLTDKYPFGNFFPVIYEANNQANQNTGKLHYNYSLLYLLNTIYNTDNIGKNVSEQSFQTVHDALAGLEWLENLNKSSGVDFGTVQTLDGDKIELGNEWYFAGYVPYNFKYQSNSSYWSASTKNIDGIKSQDAFMGNNVVMATAVPTDSSGNIYQYYAADKVGNPQANYFWQSVATNCTAFSRVEDVIININGEGNNDYTVETPSTNGDVTVQRDIGGSKSIAIYTLSEITSQLNIYIYHNKTPYNSNSSREISVYNGSTTSLSVKILNYRPSGNLKTTFDYIISGGGNLTLVYDANKYYIQKS